MSEKRKPKATILLQINGKKQKVELFDKALFEDNSLDRCSRYRIRVNGKFFPKGNKVYYTKYEFRDILFKSIEF